MGSRSAAVQMPPLGSQVVDDEALALIRSWIELDLHPATTAGASHRSEEEERMAAWKWTIGVGVTSLLVLLAGTSAAAPEAGGAQVRRGEYLVTVSGCNDCHTPWKMGPNGPEPDRTRLLSGHPQELVITEAPEAGGRPVDRCPAPGP